MFNLIPNNPEPINITVQYKQLVNNELGLDLPKSYIEYVSTYGAGTLCNFFTIFTPNSNPNIDLIKKSHELKDRVIFSGLKNGFWGTSLSEDIAQKLVPFGKSDNGDLLCWDKDNKDSHGEYPIWFLGNENEVVRNVSNNLYDFIENFCLKGQIDTLYPLGDNQKWALKPTFVGYK